MYQRVILENWHEFVPYLCFALIGGAFIIIVIRALIMKKSDVERIANLPLSDELAEPAESDSTTHQSL